MTVFILHGGVRDGTVQLLADMSFWADMAKRISRPAKVLCLYPAINPDRWEDVFKSEQQAMNERYNDSAVELSLGSNEAAQLAQQIQQASAVYIRGGYIADLVKSTFMSMPNLAELFRGKIVAGSSAGADALATYYYSRKAGLGQVLGIVRGKVMPHYNEARQAQLDELRKYGENLPVYALKEGEYVTLEV